jgi:hypothetical protein
MNVRIRVQAACLGLLILTLGIATLACASNPTVSQSYEDGKLSIRGAAFKPGEQVNVQFTVAGGQHTSLVLTTDATGAFGIDTEMVLPPGTDVQISAQGDKGSKASRP